MKGLTLAHLLLVLWLVLACWLGACELGAVVLDGIGPTKPPSDWQVFYLPAE